MAQYDVAQICLNGHVINEYAKAYPEENQKFCSTCGSLTIVSCPNCTMPIRGQETGLSWMSGDVFKHYVRPSFCINCGHPYPWTQRCIEVAKEKIEEELQNLLNDTERNALIDGLNDLVTETPKTEIVVSRFKRIMQKVPETSAILNGIIGNLATDAIKKYFGIG